VARPSGRGGRLWPPAGGSRLAARLGVCPGCLGQGPRLPRQGARQGGQRLGLPHRGRHRGGLSGGVCGRRRLGRQAPQQPGLCCPCCQRLPEIRVSSDGVPLPSFGLGALERSLGGALLQAP